jgi:drug/metabolite transporter (DMT)-like permease
MTVTGGGAAATAAGALAVEFAPGLGSINRGDVLTLGCAAMFAFQIIFVGRAMQSHRFEAIATLQAITAALLMLVTVPVAEQVFVTWSARVLWAILITALLGTSAAFAIQAWAQQFTPPTHTALIFLLEPVFAWMTSYIVLGERLGWRAGAGAMMILAGILISELKGSSRAPKEELGPCG